MSEVKNKIVRVKRYTIEEEHYEDGSQLLRRVNDGFTAMELLGLLTFITDEIFSQVRGAFKPDKIERQVVVDSKRKNKSATE